MKILHVAVDGRCPHGDEFEHRFYFGCVPKDFNGNTGRSKAHKQTKKMVHGCMRYQWDGGCDAVGDTSTKIYGPNERISPTCKGSETP